jgi:hypothetical protein
VITRALGTDPDVDVDTFTIEAQAGDVFLLCSDGLTDMVAEDEILDVVDENRADIDAALKALVKAANRSGGEDNITVVAFEIADAPLVHDGETKENVLSRPALDDEDTLSEEDAVPVIDVAEQERHERRVRGRHLRRRIVAWLVLILILAAAAVVLYVRFVS